MKTRVYENLETMFLHVIMPHAIEYCIEDFRIVQ